MWKQMQDWYGDELKAKLEEVEPDKDAWKDLCTSFLKDRLWRPLF